MLGSLVIAVSHAVAFKKQQNGFHELFFVRYNTLLSQGQNGVSHDFLFFVVIFVVPID